MPADIVPALVIAKIGNAFDQATGNAGLAALVGDGKPLHIHQGSNVRQGGTPGGIEDGRQHRDQGPEFQARRRVRRPGDDTIRLPGLHD
jgi:hypothetical protein